ncbi:MAG: hypothetical protein HYZ81_00730 [Nitrospinae bacterium]|nr:hypothetical protein [Nitrospinota bacterium]
MPQRREAAIVGIYEYPVRVVGPGTSALQIKAASAAKALEDAGLTWRDVDAVYDTAGDQGIGGLGISEYLGLKPRVIDTTYVGGSSFEFQANHARSMLAAGKCTVALLTYGSTAHSDRRAIGTAGATGVGTATFINNMEDPWGLTLIGNYAMVKTRHMFQYGTSHEQFAAICVATRHHAMRNPEAVRAMTDLEFVGVREITAHDVLESVCSNAAWCPMAGGRSSLPPPTSSGTPARNRYGSSDQGRRPSIGRTTAISPSALAPSLARSPSLTRG